MADKKNQHYVPQLYLRNFAGGDKRTHIGLKNIITEQYLPSIPLKSQAKKDYFYGKDGILEDFLGKVESDAAPVLKQIIESNILPKKESVAYADLLIFCFTMGNRTIEAAEKIKSLTDETIRTIMQFDERFKDKIEDLRIYPTNPPGMAIETTLKAIKLVTDLRVKLLINKTNVKFITSDNPLIRYNQFLEQRKHPGGIVGLATKGLQVFLPVSPDKVLCFYDDIVYRMGENKQEIIDIVHENDVNNLTGLQVVHCNDKLFFGKGHTEYYIRILTDQWKSKRINKHQGMIMQESYFDAEGREHIPFHSFSNDARLGLKFRFSRQTKKAKEYILSDYAVQLRNESLRFRGRGKNFDP